MIVIMKKIITITAYFFAACIIVAALALSIGRLMTPYFNKHLPDFETWGSQELQTPISIGSVKLTWELYEPELSFYKVAFLDQKTHQPKIEIQHLTINFSIFKSLFARKVLIENIHASGATLTIHQKSATQFTLEGFNNIEVTDNMTGSSVEGNLVLGWIFSVPDLYLEDIDLHVVHESGQEYFFTVKHLALTNSSQDHTLDGRVILNQEFPTKLNMHLNLKGRVNDLEHAQADFYMYLEGVDLLQWFKEMTWKELKILQGVGSVKVWGNWNAGALQKIQTTFQFYSLELQSLRSQKTQTFPRVSGNVGWQIKDNVQTVAGDQLFIDFPDHLWPVTAFSFSWVQNKDNVFVPEEVSLHYADLLDLKNLGLASGFLPDTFQKILTRYSPRGDIKNLHYKNSILTTDFSNLAIDASENYPGVTNVSGSLSLQKDQGTVLLDSRELHFYLPTVFAEKLIWDQVSGTIHFQKNNDDWIIQTKNLFLSNDDVRLSPEVTLTLPQKIPATIDLSSTFTVLNAAHIANYLPLKIFKENLQTWLKSAFLSGQVNSGQAVLRGTLKDFPFDHGDGLFEIKGVVSNVDLHYAPKWPILQRLNGTLDFKNRSMTADIQSGQVFNIPINSVHATITNMGGKEPEILTIASAPIQTDFADGMHFIHMSSLEETLGKRFSNMEAHGPIDLTLQLMIPLMEPEKTEVNGHINLKNIVMDMPNWKLNITNLKGVLDFKENAVLASNIQGNFFSFPMTLDIVTNHPKGNASYVVATIKTLMDIPTLEKWIDLPLAQYAEGKTAITSQVTIFPVGDSHPTEVNITSDLKGMLLKLPDAYGKKAEDTRALEVNLLAVDTGIQAKIKYADLLFGIQKEVDDWLVSVDSQNLSGKISIPHDTQSSRIDAKFSKIYISDNITSKAAAIDPKKIPPISLTANNVRYGNKNIGRVILNTEPIRDGLSISTLQINTPTVSMTATGSWRVLNGKNTSHLQGDINTATINDALREWGYPNSSLVGSKANAHFDLTWSDVIYSPSVKNISGDISFVFGEGRIVNLSQSSNAQMDLGRLLNIFNLNTIPRRLSGDFSDIFQKGYSFDSIKGRFNLSNGNAYTDKTRLEGPIASVILNGRIGLVAKDLDLNMAVTPYVTSSLPIVAAAAATGGAALVVGAATWVADKLFVGKEVSKAITHRYKITGTWDNPSWQSVGKSS